MENKELTESESNDPIISLIERLFQARDIIHLAHLKTESYAQHKALDEAYGYLLEYADKFTEETQGMEEQLLDINIPSSSWQEPLSFLTEFKEYVMSIRENLEYEFQKNISDELVGDLSKSIYLLTFLK